MLYKFSIEQLQKLLLLCRLISNIKENDSRRISFLLFNIIFEIVEFDDPNTKKHNGIIIGNNKFSLKHILSQERTYLDQISKIKFEFKEYKHRHICDRLIHFPFFGNYTSEETIRLYYTYLIEIIPFYKIRIEKKHAVNGRKELFQLISDIFIDDIGNIIIGYLSTADIFLLI